MVAKQMIRSMSGRGLACMLAAAVALVSPSVLAARPGLVPFAASSSAPDVKLEVLVSPEIVEAAELQRWIDEEGRRVLEELPDEPARRGDLRIEIGGALYDYRIMITALRDGEIVGTPSTWACECSNEELLEKLRGALPEQARALEEVYEPEAEPVITPATPSVEIDHERRRLGPAGAAGVALMAAGATGMGVGVAFMALGQPSMAVPDRDLGTTAHRDLGASGKVAAIGGGGVLLTGALLFFLRKRIDRAEDRRLGLLVPTVDARGRAHVIITGRF